MPVLWTRSHTRSALLLEMWLGIEMAMTSDEPLSKLASFILSLPVELLYLLIVTWYSVQVAIPNAASPIITKISLGFLDKIPMELTVFALLILWVNALGWYFKRTSGPVLDDRQACSICGARGHLSLISSVIYCGKCHRETASDTRKKPGPRKSAKA